MSQSKSPRRSDPRVRPEAPAGLGRAPQAPARRRGAHEIGELLVTVVLATMPLTYVQLQFGSFQLAGWAWALSLVVALAAVVAGPLDRRALGCLAPYLVFLMIGLASLVQTPDFFLGLLTLGQTSAPALAYIVVFRTPLSDRLRKRSLQIIGMGYTIAAAVVVIVGFPGPGVDSAGATPVTGAVSMAVRPLSINLIAMFLMVNALARSRLAVVAAGVASLLFTIGAGSRVASVVLLLVAWGSRVFSSRRSRAAVLLVAAVSLPIVISQPAVQDRFFFSAEDRYFGKQTGSLTDLFSLEENVDTAGRRELWPRLVDHCEDRALTGYGIGASYELSRFASNGLIDHPHNDYIRTFCDTGVVGAAAAWWCVVAVGVRNVARLRARRRDQLSASALLAAIAFLLLAVTDNVLVYAAQFTLPVFALLAWADQSGSSEVRGV